MALVLSLTLYIYLASLVEASPFAPVITPPARLHPREDITLELNPFTGYLTSWLGSEFFSLTCPTGHWLLTSKSFVDCCFVGASSIDTVDTKCITEVLTTCSGSTAYYAGGSTICSTNSCVTDAIYSGSTSDSNPLFFIRCGSAKKELFQKPPVLVQATTTDSSTRSSTATESTAFTPSSGPSSSVPTETASSAPALPSPEPVSPKEPSKAWVAGVVIGALALVAIAGLAFWMFRIRKRTQQQAYQATPQTAQVYPPQSYPEQAYSQGYASPLSAFSPYAPPSQPTHDPKAFFARPPSGLQSQSDGQLDPNRNSWYPHRAVSPATVQTVAPKVSMDQPIARPMSELPELADPPGRS